MPKTKEKKDYGMTHIAVKRETAEKIRSWCMKVDDKRGKRRVLIFDFVDDAVNYYLNKDVQK